MSQTLVPFATSSGGVAVATVAQTWGCRPSELLELHGFRALYMDMILCGVAIDSSTAESQMAEIANMNIPGMPSLDAFRKVAQAKGSNKGTAAAGLKIGQHGSSLQRYPRMMDKLQKRWAKQVESQTKN